MDLYTKQWRKPPFDFNAIEDTRGLYLDNRLLLNFKDKDLSGCVFYHCYPPIDDHRIVSLNNVASRKDVTYEGASIVSKTFVGEDMYGQLFTEGKIEKTAFYECDLDEANFDNTYMKYAHFSKVSAMGSSFKHTYMENVKMRDCDFVGSDFQHAYMEDVEMRDCEFVRSDFQHAKCKLDAREVNFSYSTFDSTIFIYKSNLYNCSFENAKLPYAELQSSIISSVSFKGADLRKADFRGASIAFSDFEGADMTGAKFRKEDRTRMQHTGLNKISQKQIDSLDVR